ncbi:hypothetical protein LEP1GSC191_1547, partial [Leptospira borgpetersenii serovar Mini str. 201000851]
VAETPEEKAYAAAKAEADSRAAQNRNNSEQGKSALDAVGYSTQRREDGLPGSQGTIGFGDADGPNPAHGAPSSHDPGQTLTSSGSFGPDGESTGGRQLSAADVAEFKADWRKESPAQTDANIAGLKAAGYDTSGLEKFVNDYRNQSKPGYGNSNQTGSPIVVNGSRTQTLGERASSIFGSVVDGAKGLWNRATGGTSSHSPIELVFKPKSSGYTDANGNYYEQFGGKVQVVDINSDANPTYWNDKKFNQHHGGENYKADISAKGGSYGPGVPFKVLKAGLEEGFGGVVVVAPNGDESKGIKIGHFTRINSTIYNAVKSGILLPAGTPLGFADSKIGYSSGPHFHIVKDKKAGDSNNEQNLKWLQGE